MMALRVKAACDAVVVEDAGPGGWVRAWAWSLTVCGRGKTRQDRTRRDNTRQTVAGPGGMGIAGLRVGVRRALWQWPDGGRYLDARSIQSWSQGTTQMYCTVQYMYSSVPDDLQVSYVVRSAARPGQVVSIWESEGSLLLVASAQVGRLPFPPRPWNAAMVE